MPIIFTHERLHVGFRAKDWSDVWYEADENKNAEGEAENLLYRLTVGPAGYREPMEGEVKWSPQFDIKNCESSSSAERKRMQKQFLTDAHKYLTEKDPETLRTMEEELEQPGFSRWQSWFKEAKKYKKAKMRQRDNRRRGRIQKALQHGATEAEARKQVNSDTSDSAYESDQERPPAPRSSTNMSPPPRPTKRKSGKSGLGGRQGGTKRERLNDVLNDDSFMMSGGAARSSTGHNSNSNSGIGSVAASEGHIDQDDESIMDTRDPRTPPPTNPTIQQTWGWENMPTGASPRRRGRSPGTSSFHGGGSRNDGNQANGAANPLNGAQQPVDNDDENDPAERVRRHLREQSTVAPDEDDAVLEAIRQSLAPDDGRGSEEVRDSIEADEDDS